MKNWKPQKYCIRALEVIVADFDIFLISELKFLKHFFNSKQTFIKCFDLIETDRSEKGLILCINGKLPCKVLTDHTKISPMKPNVDISVKVAYP